MIKSLTGGILTALAILVAIGLFLPSTYQIERSIDIQAPLSTTFDQINTLRNWQYWAYEQQEDATNLQYEGPESGLGAIYTWHDEYSTGRMEIKEEIPEEKVMAELVTDYGALSSQLTFTFKHTDNRTTVNWIQSGDVGYDIRARFIIWVGGLDKSVGVQNEASLKRLKAILEK